MSPTDNKYVPGNNVVHGVVPTDRGRNIHQSGNFRFDDSMKQMKQKSQHQQYYEQHQRAKGQNVYNHRGNANNFDQQHFEISARASEHEEGSNSSMHVKRLGERSPQEDDEEFIDENEEKRHLQQQYQQEYSYGEEDEDCIEIDE